MFIKLGERRINLTKIREYYPLDNANERYLVVFLYGKDEKEEIHFFARKEERDLFLDKLDSALIKH